MDGNKVSLKTVKARWNLDYRNNSSKLSEFVKEEYRFYLYSPSDYINRELNFDDVIECCEGMEPQLIPYSPLTDIIFNNDMKTKDLLNEEINESNFASEIESKFERYLIQKFGDEPGTTQDGVFPSSEETINFNKIKHLENKITIFYKVIEHLKLAISQKEGLYNKQKKDLVDLSVSLEKAREDYDNMISNFISILGIFAAILMTAFGGIQAFSAIYKDNSFSLEDSLIIACIGFMGVLLLIFMLLNSIAKLTGKSIDSKEGSLRWYLRHPTLINSFILLSSIICVIITMKIVDNPPKLNKNYWLWIIPIVYPLLMFFVFNRNSNSKHNRN